MVEEVLSQACLENKKVFIHYRKGSGDLSDHVIGGIIQQWKANACTFGCGLRSCNDAGVWRYRDATTGLVHTFFLPNNQSKKNYGDKKLRNIDYDLRMCGNLFGINSFRK